MSTHGRHRLLLRVRCPACGTRIETRDFGIRPPANRWLQAHRIVFRCPDCGAALKIRERYYRYYNLFVGYIMLVILAGLVASFFVQEPMRVSFAMLAALVLAVPLGILTARHHKAEVDAPDMRSTTPR